jgi:uncharacterized protein (DUF3084 family)
MQQYDAVEMQVQTTIEEFATISERLSRLAENAGALYSTAKDLQMGNLELQEQTNEIEKVNMGYQQAATLANVSLKTDTFRTN